jgi:GNAT superfamily N-acetyltransferase
MKSPTDQFAASADAGEFRWIESDQDVLDCAPLLRALRTYFESDEVLVAQIARQREQGYLLIGRYVEGQVVGVAGFRPVENLIHGRFVYVDDLVVAQSARRSGVAMALLDDVARISRSLGAKRVVLDAALANSSAHALYLRHGMKIVAFHFVEEL